MKRLGTGRYPAWLEEIFAKIALGVTRNVLRVPVPEQFMEIMVHDADGKLIDHRGGRAHSWTRNAYNLLFMEMAGSTNYTPFNVYAAGGLAYKDQLGNLKSSSQSSIYGMYTDGVDAYESADSSKSGYRGASNSNANGILVGSSDAAENFDDYILAAKIVSGTAAGQLSYAMQEVHVRSYDSGAKVFQNELKRFFNNNSGGNVSVSEIGLSGYIGQSSTGYYVLMARDVLPSPVTVPNGGQLTVIYLIKLQYPA
jgi:hypothetical protein